MATTDPTVRLTSFSHGAGCACKLSPRELGEVMGLLGDLGPPDPNLLVGLGTSDDAAVYQVRDDLAVVFTTDFFTPIVDDAYDWGRIAATNALSDVYAMGGTPLIALNLVAWPRDALPFELLAEVLRGGADAARGAGCLVVGGHSIDDPEPKYGMAVVGTVSPDRVLTNGGARPGDALVLTKPIGIGTITTGLKRELASPELVATAVGVMTTLNADAAAAAATVGIGADSAVHAGTDVTGFGLLGHLLEMARASGVGIEINLEQVPMIEGARQLIDLGAVAGGTQRNHEWVDPHIEWGDHPLATQFLLADAQTSGGLVLACDPKHVDALVTELERLGTPAAAVIGQVTAERSGRLSLIPATAPRSHP